MTEHSVTLAAKVADVRAAHEDGRLAAHEVAKAMDAADASVASSWGPAMRR